MQLSAAMYIFGQIPGSCVSLCQDILDGLAAKSIYYALYSKKGIRGVGITRNEERKKHQEIELLVKK